MKRKVLALALAALITSAPIAFADFSVTATSPAGGTSLTVAPNVVSITASTQLLPVGNSIVVNDPNGVEVDDGSITTDGASVIVGMKPLTLTGVYTVTYNLLADGSPELAGSYTFLFNAPATLSAPSAKPTANSKVTLNEGNNAASNAFVYFLLFLAALMAIFLVWYARVIFSGKTRRRRPTRNPIAVEESRPRPTTRTTTKRAPKKK